MSNIIRTIEGNGYYIRQLKQEEFGLLDDLYKKSYNRRKQEGYFKWKFTDNPEGLGIVFMAFSPEDEPAATYIFLPQPFYINGRKYTFLQSCNAMTHPDHRRKGLFKQLHEVGNEYLENNNHIGISYSGPKTIDYKLSTGWTAISKMRTYFFPSQLNFFANNKKNERVVPIKDISLINEITKEKKLSNTYVEKSTEMFRWRLNNPDRDYKILAVKGDNKLTSYLIYVVEDNKIDIFDFFMNSIQDSKDLIGELKRIMKVNKYNAILCLTNQGSYYAKTLGKRNFLVNKTSRGPLHNYFPLSVYFPKKVNQRFSEKDVHFNSYESDAY